MNYGGYFEPSVKQQRITELEQIMSSPNFWDNQRESEIVISELNLLKRQIDEVSNLKIKIENNIELLDSLKEEIDIEILSLLEEDITEIENKLDNLEIELLLNGPCYIECMIDIFIKRIIK